MSALIPNLVPSFIVEPVLRQARRFSRGSFASPAAAAPSADSTAGASSSPLAQQEDRDQQDSSGSGSGGDGAAGRRQLLEGHPEDAAVDSGLGLRSGPHPSSSSLNRPLPDRLAPHRTLPSAPVQGSGESPVEEAPSSQHPPTEPTDLAGPIRSSDTVAPATEAAAASLGMAAAQRDAIETQDGDPAPLARGSANDGTISATPQEYLRPEALPEDDGMGPLRRRILEIHSRPIPAAEKAQLLHIMFTEGYERSRLESQDQKKKKRASSHSSHSANSEGGGGGVLYEQAAAQGPLESLKFWQLSLGESSTPPRFLLTEDDLKPTYAPVKRRYRGRYGAGSGVFSLSEEFIGGSGGPQQQEPQHMGCEHYRRNVKLQCNTCQKWYTCRLCHDEAEDHSLPRKETKNMLCMPCGYAQKAGDECVRCGRLAARYYCGTCKLWNDDPDASTYHCDGCGICRVGAGLGKDFFHCKSCGICIAIETKDSHRCREGAMDCNCPICGEYMFTSTKRMIHMNPCRHLIHKRCYEQHMLTSYKCPICSKSTRNMESLFRKWDQNIAEQPMPPEWASARAIIYCNDCEAKSQTLYHWVGLKCSICKGYNTREVQILNAPGSGPPTTAAAPPSGADDAAAGMLPTATGVEAAGTGATTSSALTPAATEVATAALAAPIAAVGGAAPPGTAHRSSAFSGPRDIVQPRRSVSHMPGASVGGMRTMLPVQPPERYARSLSPTPVFPDIESDPEDATMDDDDDDGRSNDMIDFDFWSRVGLGRLGGSDGRLFGEAEGSGDDVDDEDDSEDDDDESSEEGDAREDEEDDDNEITLFGHR
ncbi:hypothetical protein RB595_004766 [Gaeumannomyces hyphopodioides]